MPKVLGHRVLVLPDPIKEFTKGGIVIPDSARDRQQLAETRGTVVDVGETAFTGLYWTVYPKAGDRIAFAQYAGVVSKLKNGEHRIINDEDVLMTLTPEDEEA